MSTVSKSQNLVIELITGLGLGGAERVAVELTQELNKQNIDVHLVSLTNDTRILSQYPDIEKITRIFDLRTNPIHLLRMLHELKILSSSYQNVVIHAHMFHALVAAVILKFLIPRISIVFTSHTYAGFTLIRKLFVKLTRRFRMTDIIFAADQHIEMNAADTRVIPNFAPRVVTPQMQRSHNHDQDGPLVFAFIGRMNSIKNPLAIVQSFKELPQDAARLLMVGDGPLLGEVHAYVAQNGMQSRVDVLGPRHDVGAILDEVDVLVMASAWEGLPMVILEAGARGITVIAPPVGAIPLLLADGCGYLCHPHELASKMNFILNNNYESLKKGRRLKSKIHVHYSIDKSVKRHRELYFHLKKRP